MRKPNHHMLRRTWDLRTLRENLGFIQDYIEHLKRDGEDATEWETRAADLRDEIAARTYR